MERCREARFQTFRCAAMTRRAISNAASSGCWPEEFRWKNRLQAFSSPSPSSSAVPHGGGKRFETESHDYNVLVQWIANGAKPPMDNDARIERVEILRRTPDFFPKRNNNP